MFNALLTTARRLGSELFGSPPPSTQMTTATREVVGEPDRGPDPSAEAEPVDPRELDRLRHELREETRRRQELFRACESLERQRDRFQDLYRRQTMEHGAAQAVLERRMAACLQQRDGLLKLLNARLEKAGEPAVALDPKRDPAGGPLDLAETFLRRHIELFTEALREFGLPPMPSRAKAPAPVDAPPEQP